MLIKIAHRPKRRDQNDQKAKTNSSVSTPNSLRDHHEIHSSSSSSKKSTIEHEIQGMLRNNDEIQEVDEESGKWPPTVAVSIDLPSSKGSSPAEHSMSRKMGSTKSN